VLDRYDLVEEYERGYTIVQRWREAINFDIRILHQFGLTPLERLGVKARLDVSVSQGAIYQAQFSPVY